MNNTILAAAAVAALWAGSAYAQDREADAPGNAPALQDQQLAYATSTREQVSIYAAARGEGYSHGGEQ